MTKKSAMFPYCVGHGWWNRGVEGSSKACGLTGGWHRGCHASESRARESSARHQARLHQLTVGGRQRSRGPAELGLSPSADAVLGIQGELQGASPTRTHRERKTHRYLSQRAGEGHKASVRGRFLRSGWRGRWDQGDQGTAGLTSPEPNGHGRAISHAR